MRDAITALTLVPEGRLVCEQFGLMEYITRIEQEPNAIPSITGSLCSEES
jgi:hypothetical protein